MKECCASVFLVYDRCFCENDNAVTSGLLGSLILNEQKLCLYFIFFLLCALDAGWYKFMNNCRSGFLTHALERTALVAFNRMQRLNVILASCQISIHLHEMSHAQTWPHRVLNDSSMLRLGPGGNTQSEVRAHQFSQHSGEGKKKKKKVVINSSQQAYGWM